MTDDNSSMSANQFDSQLTALDPMFDGVEARRHLVRTGRIAERLARGPGLANAMTKRLLVNESYMDLDSAIERLQEGPYIDDLQLRRLKKRKLQLKDFIALLESELILDLDA